MGQEAASSNKEEIRARIRARRRDREYDPAVAAAIAEHVTDIDEIAAAAKRHAVIACYVSRSEEPDSSLVRQALHALGAQVVVPRIDGTELHWCFDDPQAQWTTNSLGIQEPQGPSAHVQPEIFIVPALAIDHDGHRVGQGGGFYDRALTGAGNPLVIALVFEDEVLASVPHEPHDQPVDIAVTQARVRWFSMPD